MHIDMDEDALRSLTNPTVQACNFWRLDGIIHEFDVTSRNSLMTTTCGSENAHSLALLGDDTSMDDAYSADDSYISPQMDSSSVSTRDGSAGSDSEEALSSDGETVEEGRVTLESLLISCFMAEPD